MDQSYAEQAASEADAPHPMRRISDQVTPEGAHDDERDMQWVGEDRVPTEDVFRRRFRLDLPLPRRPKDMAEEIRALREALEGAYRRIAYLENLADTDPLVPAYNRRAFLRELSRALSFSTRYDIPSSLIFFKVTNMRKVIDAYGEAAGDQLVAHVAQMMVRNVRQSDAVGRLATDQFAILLTHAAENNAVRKGENLAGMISQTPMDMDGVEIAADVVWGVHGIIPGETPEAALDRGDDAMYSENETADV